VARCRWLASSSASSWTSARWRAPRRVVGRLGVGPDTIGVAGCEVRGIRSIPATGANAQSVAEHVIAAGMRLPRGAFGASAEVAAGRWPRAALSGGREIAGEALGLIGFGSTGPRTAAPKPKGSRRPTRGWRAGAGEAWGPRGRAGRGQCAAPCR
jgi:phosphoglycerate dehydrogenase-like enzyme